MAPEEREEGLLAKQVREPEADGTEAAPALATETGSIDDMQSDALGGTGMTYAGTGGPAHAAGSGAGDAATGTGTPNGGATESEADGWAS